MESYDKPGSFYLGKIRDITKDVTTNDYFLYESKNLTTHAVCVGMTGSGKTGLGIDLIEEAALNGIPSIVIDPKGDLGNLLLTFPDLTANEFLPWIDTSEAERLNLTPQAYAEKTATDWKEGLANWGEGPDRIKKLKNAVEMAIYTPASDAGIPLSILGSFEAPSKELILDRNALLERVQSTTSSLLGLIGINADPLKSREHILISTIINQAWQNGQNLDLVSLIQMVQKPPFDKIGALDLETFYPTKDRTSLSISLNGLLASPGFQSWMEGEPLDVQKLLYTAEKKPRVSVISIAHLNDSERMFFMTLLLNQVISWMRKQAGTSSLRAIFYMDEIYGFFPPTASPPSKTPMLTMLKQARAYGLGIVLATQNPVDLDYKGLSNCGTWFIGKLQTDRDKARILEGLAAASNGELDSKSLGELLSSIGKRIFIMRSIYEKKPVVFESRWTMSYLRGPLTLSQIQSLTPKADRQKIVFTKETSCEASSQVKPVAPNGIKEYFLNQNVSPGMHYVPTLLGVAKLHFTDAKSKVDVWKEVTMIDQDGTGAEWEEQDSYLKKSLTTTPLANSSFDDIPANLMNTKKYADYAKSLATFLYQNQSYPIYHYADLNLLSAPDEKEDAFRQRVIAAEMNKGDGAAQKIRDQYTKRIDTLNQKLRAAQDKYEQKRTQSGWQKAQTFISIGASILGAVMGKKVTKTTINDASTSMRKIGKMGQDGQVVSNAEENVSELQQQLAQVQQVMNDQLSKVSASKDPSLLKIDTIEIKPRKSDIMVEEVALLWK